MNFFKIIPITFNNIKIFINSPSNFISQSFHIKNGENILNIKNYSICENYINAYINGELNIKFDAISFYGDSQYKIPYYPLFKTEAFDKKFYTTSTLGNLYTKDYTIFRLWSPPALWVNLIIYEKGEPEEGESREVFPMKEQNGLWFISVNKNLDGYFYTFEISIYNNINEVIDPYTKAVGINGIRGAIIDLQKSNPVGWDKDIPLELKNYTDAIIYEGNIRDISIHPYSGVKNKGKFLGLTEKDTQYNNVSTVLNHLKELGITHLQLLPIFDFSYKSTDEKDPHKYNWGYDPQNYNVPEGSYCSNPYNPNCRIFELKSMILCLHQNNISVNMDVVFNHIFEHWSSYFEKIFPSYYFRHNNDGTLSNGSGCGNDIASEHSMVRKFIIDSVIYWANEYHINGFRFDLMGLIDTATMLEVENALYSLNKNIMLYGEGWDLNTPLSKEEKSIQENSHIFKKTGFFNDKFRDIVKGSIFNMHDKGFATGKEGLENEIKKCILGSIDYDVNLKGLYKSPEQSINYVCCHDNNTLWDKIDISCNYDSFEDKKRMLMLCSSIVLLSQGVPFLHCGIDFCRTKNGVENSFNKPDNINYIDWNRKSEFIDVFEYHKKIISLRKEHSAFRMNAVKDIKNHLSFIENCPQNSVAFILKNHANNDVWKDILVIFNANKEGITINLPNGGWNTFISSNNTNYYDNQTLINNLYVDKISTTVLYKF